MILVINAGSSSLKCKLYDEEKTVLSIKKERIGQKDGFENHKAAWTELYKEILPYVNKIQGVGHRILHGGEFYREPVLINNEVLCNLHQLSQMAPLHMPPALTVIEESMKILSSAPHVGVFDTAFYKDLPEKVYIYPLPKEIRQKFSIRKYGFHGISHQNVVKRAIEKLPKNKIKRIVSCHLGAGSSISAIKDGICIDTSMGFTPLEGITMMTRPGDLDVGIILKLLDSGISRERLDDIIHRQSGLYGISGISDDMRDLLYLSEMENDDKNYIPAKNIIKNDESKAAATLAINTFIYKIIKYIGAYIAVIGGLDALIFTGTIGANSKVIRDLVIEDLKFLGDFEVLAIAPDEEKEIAEQVEKFIK